MECRSHMLCAKFGIFGEDSWGALEKEGKKCDLKWCEIAKADTLRSQGKGTIWREGMTEVSRHEESHWVHEF